MIEQMVRKECFNRTSWNKAQFDNYRDYPNSNMLFDISNASWINFLKFMISLWPIGG
jgi:hypothetical protein